jgi:GMP synthase-like glutamine amidotransferase
VQDVIEGLDDEEMAEIDSIGILKVHSDMVSKLPDGAVLHGSSTRAHNELWTIADRVFCI